MYRLIAFSGDDRGREWPLRLGRNTLGRALGTDVQLQDGKASRVHCAIDFTDDGVWIEDLGSLNSTYVNGRRIEKERISNGCQITIGDTNLLLNEVQEDEGEYLERTVVQTVSGPRKLRDYEEQLMGHGIVGQSGAMVGVLDLIDRVAQTDAPVLVSGPPGSGKELCAYAIHWRGARREKSFVPIGCAALSDRLLESLLFGHERGAFAGATTTRDGALHYAKGGTIYLEEIAEMPLGCQAKLLRVIEDQTFFRLGSDKPELVESRIVTSTSQDLEQAVREKLFRQDLLYSLNAVRLEIPPLSQRGQDIRLLAEQLIEKVCCRYSVPPKTLSPDAIEALETYDWPGNVRELHSCMERAVLLGGSTLILPGDLGLRLRR
ncbi:MAG: sigma 54-interacting transcriptional regulator [Acidobacteriota bacterium]